MAQYMDLGQFKENPTTGKVRFIKLGYAKEDGKGGRYLNFDALPLPDDQGRVSVRMIPQRDRSEGQSDQTIHHQGGAPQLDDDVPFGPEVR